MDTTEILDAINDTRKTTPYKYIWGKFTPDKDGVGFSELPLLSSPKPTDKVVVDNGGASLCQCTLQALAFGLVLSADSLSVTDWNTLSGVTGYKFIHTIANETINSPENVTADWFAEFVSYGTSVMVTVTKCSNPRSRYIRMYYNGAWSDWVSPYASYHP